MQMSYEDQARPQPGQVNMAAAYAQHEIEEGRGRETVHTGGRLIRSATATGGP
jgi:hypothetical protein